MMDEGQDEAPQRSYLLRPRPQSGGCSSDGKAATRDCLVVLLGLVSGLPAGQGPANCSWGVVVEGK